jgi:hypothetical protein
MLALLSKVTPLGTQVSEEALKLHLCLELLVILVTNVRWLGDQAKGQTESSLFRPVSPTKHKKPALQCT